MRSTYRCPIRYALSRINYLRNALKEKENLEDKIKLIDIIQGECIEALKQPVVDSDYPVMRYNLNIKPDPVEAYLRQAEISLTGKQPIGVKRSKLMDCMVHIKYELRKGENNV
jgi:hypothetical protein